MPSPFTRAKSLTLLNKRLAILGVPRLRLANSLAASSVIGVFKTREVLLIIKYNSS